MNTQTLTKEQTQRLFDMWSVTEKLPRKNQKVIVSFPRKTTQFGVVVITRLSDKSTDGKPLFSVDMQNPQFA